ncbi:MAG: hypothetical protein K2W85_13985 [Phycisphaerales bacterium]|nr:hypothetical protein [Phycisphaerales bacterium]
MGVAAVAGSALAASADKFSSTQPAAQSIQAENGYATGGTPIRFAPRGPGNGCAIAANQCQERTTLAVADPRASNASFANGFAVADNFQVPATTLTSICWWGYYGPSSVNGTPPVAGAEGFRIRIYTNVQGVPTTQVAEIWAGANFLTGPGATAGSTLTRNAALGVPTGAAVPAGTTMFTWTANIAPLNLPAGCYWLEISADSVANVDQRFRWIDSTNVGGPNDGVTLQTPANPGTYTFNNIVNSFDRAFCLGFASATALATPNCSVPPPAPNNSCANATVVGALPFAVSGGTFRSAYSAVPFCGTNPINAPTVFYRVVGNGTTFTAASCGTTTDFDTVINVYCATTTTGTGAQICGTGNANLRCIGNNDDGPATCTGATGAFPSQFSWPTVAGNVYIVALFGFELDIGSFDFSITSDGVPAGVTGVCVSDRCPVDLTGITNLETDACGTTTASLNSACNGTSVRPFTLGVPFGGNTSNDPVGTAGGANRDFDFWELSGTLPDNSGGQGISWIRVTYRSEFPGRMQFYTGACNAPTNDGTFIGGAAMFYTAFGTPTPICQDRNIIVDAAAGQAFRLTPFPTDFGGVPCAAGNNNYRITVSLEPTGACCVPATACFVTAQIDCDTQLGVWTSGAACSPLNPCEPSGACCIAPGNCSITNQGTCTGTWTSGGTCAVACPAPTTGVCCRGSTCNATVAQAACTTTGTQWGASFNSSAAACSSTSATAPCCFADYDKTAGIQTGDIFAFLNDWFSSSPFATVGGDGTTLPVTGDIFSFLNAWFAGGC